MTTKEMEIEVWVCTSCGNYYASSSAGDLRQEWNTEKNTQRPTFPRSRCPTPECASQGIDRIPLRIAIDVPVEHIAKEA